MVLHCSVREHRPAQGGGACLCGAGQGGRAELRLQFGGAGAVRRQVVQERTRVLPLPGTDSSLVKFIEFHFNGSSDACTNSKNVPKGAWCLQSLHKDGVF